MVRQILLGILATLLLAVSINAQSEHKGMHGAGDKLGDVNFRVSCSPKAQNQFNRAVAWLHSFEYEEAEKAFGEVVATDPRCGMAYWGIAMSNYHQLWAPPTPAELKRGLDAAEKAKSIGAQTEREKGFINAIGVFYQDVGKIDHRARTLAYSDALKRVYEQNPSDVEAAVFYALSLITVGTMSRDATFARELEAATILNRILTKAPQHPGVAHYLIHGYDYPSLANHALAAARSYAKIAPASAHAQHMPSHIFTRLGFWQEAIQSNLDAYSASQAYAVRNHLPGVWDEQLHAMDYLVYAYLQGAQDKKALSVLTELNNIRQVDPMTFKVAYAVSVIPARYAIERRQWKEAANLPLYPSRIPNFPWDKFPSGLAQTQFAQAIGAARTGDTASAKKAIEALSKTLESIKTQPGDYDWSKPIDISRQIASAWLLYAEGNSQEALKLMHAAAELDDSTEKHPVTPGVLMPAREQLGELLLELKNPHAALEAFQRALQRTPNRFNALYGAARSARSDNDMSAAAKYYRQLIAISRFSDSVRPELEEAKSFVGSSTTTSRR